MYYNEVLLLIEAIKERKEIESKNRLAEYGYSALVPHMDKKGRERFFGDLQSEKKPIILTAEEQKAETEKLKKALQYIKK